MDTYFHVTLKCNLPSIRRRGLLARYARGKRPAVWIVRRQDVLWALAHTWAKPWARGQKLAVVQINARGYRLKGHRSEKCLWVSEDVPPDRISVCRSLDLLTGRVS